MLIIGYEVKLAALIIAFDMLMAIILVFRNNIFTIKEMGGGWTIELEMFFLLTSIAIFFLGAGKYSVQKRRLLR